MINVGGFIKIVFVSMKIVVMLLGNNMNCIIMLQIYSNT